MHRIGHGIRSVAAGLGLAVTASGATAADPQMQAGKWDYTIKTEIPGMPMAMPPMRFQQCLTAEDVREGAVAQDPGSDMDCKISNLQQDAGRMRYDMTCTGDETVTSRADFKVSPTTLAGTVATTIDGQTVTQRFDARRSGDCTGK